MATAILERVKENETASQNSEPPHRWQVVMYSDSKQKIQCCTRLLQDVFHMNSEQASQHVEEAKIKGRSALFQSSKDVVETKAAEAELARNNSIRTCAASMKRVIFKPEPAP